MFCFLRRSHSFFNRRNQGAAKRAYFGTLVIRLNGCILNSLQAKFEIASRPQRSTAPISITFDAIGWATDIPAQLRALADAPACPERLQDRLKRHADWLIDTLSWIPEDKNSVTFVENFALTECLFEVALESLRRGDDDLHTKSSRLLLGGDVVGMKPGGRFWSLL